MAGLAVARASLLLLVVAVACGGEPRVPVELDLTAFGAALVDGRPETLTVETAGMHRRIVQAPGAPLELAVRVPHEARLRFSLDPATAADAFAVTARAAGVERALRPRSTGAGDWECAVDVGEPGSPVALRFENRGARTLSWWALRLAGTVPAVPPVLPATLRPPPGPLNVVVFVSDALRADHLSLHGYRRPTSPELARLAARHGVVFDHAYAAGPSTPSSIPALFTSRHASALGINFRAVAGRTDRTLAEAMNLGGLRTAAFVGNPLLLPQFGYDRGFATYDIVPPDDERLRYPRAATLVDRVLEYLTVNRDAPSFVYVQVMDTHSPYDPPPPHRGRFYGTGPPPPATPPRASDPPLPIPQDFAPRPGPWADLPAAGDHLHPDRYDETIAYVDAELGRMMRELDALGLRERTAVVVTADHGEALGAEDDGGILHGHALFEELVHVPLVLLLPWLEGERRVTEPVSHLDLGPTLLDLLGLPAPESFTGRSFFDARVSIDRPAVLLERLEPHWTTHKVLGQERFGVAEWGMREDRWKLLLERHRVRLYDLVADPKETSDVSWRHPELTAYLAGRIARTSPAFTQRERPPVVDPAPGGLERPLAEALKALGYIGGE